MDSFLIKMKYCFKIKDLYLAWEAMKKIINWPEYFLDFFSLSMGKFTVFKMCDSLKYLVRAKTWDRGIITRIHLADEYNINELFLPSDSVVIDIGAHIGIFSVYISKKACRVFAYEPIPENYYLLKQNIKLNNLEKKVNIFNLAVSDRKEKLKIYLSEFNTAGHSEYKNNNSYVEVEAISLKDILDFNNFYNCDLLKIDVEGAEYKILFGLPKEYFKRIKCIRLEHHKIESGIDNYNLFSLKNLLEKNGFNVIIDDHILFADKIN
jgi:FkbM family methyltransferase